MPSPAFLALLLAAAQPPPPRTVHFPPPPIILFYAYDEDALDARNRMILDGLIDHWRRGGAAHFLVEGHSDTADPADQSMDASRRRAWAVHDYLVEAGIPSRAIIVRYHGEARLLIGTQDEVREPQNRRVEIRFGPAEDAPPR
jgi:OOP family OmpA-OmpF porin